MFKRRVQAKMTASKALCLMGFGVTATVDQAMGEDPKETLNRALFGQMQALMLRKREAMEEKVKIKSRGFNSSGFHKSPVEHVAP